MAWTLADDKKLAQLFRRGSVSRGGLSSKNIKPSDIHDAINRFFPEYTKRYSSFAPLFRRKANAWNIEQEIAGKRRKSKSIKQVSHKGSILSHLCCFRHLRPEDQQDKTEEDEEDEDDEDYSDNEEEDDEDELDEDFIEEEEAKRDSKDSKMPPKKPTPRKSNRTPPRKKAPPAAAAPPPPCAAAGEDTTDEDLSAGMDQLSLKGASYDLDCKWGYMMFTHLVDKREHCKIHMWVPTLPTSHFKVTVHPNDPSHCHVITYYPDMFYDEDRLKKARKNDASFNRDTHENTVYKKLSEKVSRDFEDENNPLLVVTGDPQVVPLPFPCESAPTYKVVYHGSRDLDGIPVPTKQYLSVLEIDLKNVVKPKVNNAATYDVVDSDDDDGDTNMAGAQGS